VIFDADGTLVDSEGIGLGTMARRARHCGVVIGDDEVASLRGQRMALCLAVLEQRLGRALPPDFEAALRADMAQAFAERLQPMPGAHEVLQGLQGLRVPFCVATNGPRAKVDLTLRVAGLSPYLEGRVFCAPEVGSFKPDPGLFLAAAAALGVPPARCAVVEDSEPGALAGLSAGMQVFAVRHSHSLPAALQGSIRVLEGLPDLLAFQRVRSPVLGMSGAQARGGSGSA